MFGLKMSVHIPFERVFGVKMGKMETFKDLPH